MKNIFNLIVLLLVAVLIAGGLLLSGLHPEWLAWSVAFFDGFTAEQLVATIAVAVLFLWPDAGVAFLNWIKNKLGLADQEAHKAVLVILCFFSAVVMLLTGVFTGEFTFANLVYFMGEAYLLSQYTYKRINP